MNEDLDPVIHQNKSFYSIVNVGAELGNRQFFNCTFNDCELRACDLGSCEFMDCQFIACDLSFVNVNRSGFRNVLFNDCKITDVDFSGCNRSLFSVEFTDCILDHANFNGARVAFTKFTDCSLQSVDFREADLSGALFENCDLIHARFGNSILEATDFRSAYHFEIDPNLNRIRNALFSDRNVQGLLCGFGVDIRESKSYCEVILDLLMDPAF